MSPTLVQGLVALALLSTGVVYVCFALVTRLALRQADEASLTQALGHVHAVADARMPVFGATALLATVALAAGGWGTWPGWLELLALAGQLTQLLAYVRVAQPVSRAQTAVAQHGIVSPMPGHCKSAGIVSSGYGPRH
jgi:hypothetical protein